MFQPAASERASFSSHSDLTPPTDTTERADGSAESPHACSGKERLSAKARAQELPQEKERFQHTGSSAQASAVPAPSSAPFVLPRGWQELLAKTPAAPVVWTYAELGDDLAGNAVAERSASLRRIIQALQLPRGTSAFWPVALPAAAPHQEQGASASGCFGHGLTKISPKVVIFLGTASLHLSQLPLDLSLHFMQAIYQGRLYLLVPSFDEIMGNPGMEDRVTRYLRTVLSGFNLSTSVG